MRERKLTVFCEVPHGVLRPMCPLKGMIIHSSFMVSYKETNFDWKYVSYNLNFHKYLKKFCNMRWSAFGQHFQDNGRLVYWLTESDKLAAQNSPSRPFIRSKLAGKESGGSSYGFPGAPIKYHSGRNTFEWIVTSPRRTSMIGRPNFCTSTPISTLKKGMI